MKIFSIILFIGNCWILFKMHKRLELIKKERQELEILRKGTSEMWRVP